MGTGPSYEAQRSIQRKNAYEVQKSTLQESVSAGIDYARETADEEVLELIDEQMIRLSGESQLTLQEKKMMRQEVFYSIRRLDVLEDLLASPEITEIMINGAGHIFVEEKGAVREADCHFSSEEKLMDVVQRIVSSCNKVVNAASPIADARLAGGERVSVVLPPVALNGPVVTIRKFPEKPVEMNDLIGWESISAEAAAFLGRLVAAGYNIFISGGTGSGKTTFLNALTAFIPPTERVITIEDNAELQILHIPNLVRMETRDAHLEGCTPVSIRDLIKTSLRMRPDRIIVGEVRGAETIDMVQAMNTGHDGSLSTGHANSAADMMERLVVMYMMGMDLNPDAIRRQLASGIDIVVHLGRLRDRSRKVLEIAQTQGSADGHVRLCTLYRFREEGERNGRIYGRWEKTGELTNTFKLALAGLS